MLDVCALFCLGNDSVINKSDSGFSLQISYSKVFPYFSGGWKIKILENSASKLSFNSCTWLDNGLLLSESSNSKG